MTKIGNNSLNDNENDDVSDGNKTSKTKRREGDASRCVASFSNVCGSFLLQYVVGFSPMCVAAFLQCVWQIHFFSFCRKHQ